MDASFLLIRTMTFVVFGFFLILITVLGISFVIVFFGLQFGRLITRLRQGVNHFLDGVVLFLPPAYVGVHVLHKFSRLSGLHLINGNIVPSSVLHLQVRQKEFDLELPACEFFRC